MKNLIFLFLLTCPLVAQSPFEGLTTITGTQSITVPFGSYLPNIPDAIGLKQTSTYGKTVTPFDSIDCVGCEPTFEVLYSIYDQDYGWYLQEEPVVADIYGWHDIEIENIIGAEYGVMSIHIFKEAGNCDPDIGCEQTKTCEFQVAITIVPEDDTTIEIEFPTGEAIEFDDFTEIEPVEYESNCDSQTKELVYDIYRPAIPELNLPRAPLGYVKIKLICSHCRIIGG